VERMLLAVAGLSLILGDLVFTQKSVGAKVCAAVGAAALLGAIVIGGRRWWRQRKDPKRPSGPNYNRTPYV
jgi:drug/metabolite transporter (DMT)-like permease